MKKIFILFTAFSLFLLLAPAGAEENPSTATATPVVTAPATNPPASPAIQPVYKPREVVLSGDLTTISGQAVPVDLTIKLSRVIPAKIKNFPGAYPVKDAAITVRVSDKTKIVRRYGGRAHLSELAVGDKLWAVGRLQADGTVNGSLAKDNSIHITFFARRGAVLSLDAASQTFALKVANSKKESKEYKIYVTPNTKFAKRGAAKPSLADLKVGNIVAVRGVIRQATNEITADSVVIQLTDEEIKAEKEQKKNIILKKQLENKKWVLEKQIKKAK
ncbi:MAG: hypothetical protein HY982_01200 [Candidatus Magasanikbacteria bacterium]|nr:hypothetical protein [Candidatus Magasanikbacteria bacterium]